VVLHSTISRSTIDSSWCPGEPPPAEGLQHTVGFIEMELRALNLRKNRLSERIVAIKQTITGLAELFGTEVVDQQLPSVRFSEPPGRRRAQPGLTDSCRQLLRSRPCDQNPTLNRACRIALLENLAFMSEKEIYSRIVRRGSFTFTNAHLALADVADELNTLIERGQARCIEIGNERRWQRAILADEVGSSAQLTNGAR